MFELSLEFIKDFLANVPYFIPLILIINLCAGLLWGDK